MCVCGCVCVCVWGGCKRERDGRESLRWRSVFYLEVRGASSSVDCCTCSQPPSRTDTASPRMQQPGRRCCVQVCVCVCVCRPVASGLCCVRWLWVVLKKGGMRRVDVRAGIHHRSPSKGDLCVEKSSRWTALKWLCVFIVCLCVCPSICRSKPLRGKEVCLLLDWRRTFSLFICVFFFSFWIPQWLHVALEHTLNELIRSFWSRFFQSSF